MPSHLRGLKYFQGPATSNTVAELKVFTTGTVYLLVSILGNSKAAREGIIIDPKPTAKAELEIGIVLEDANTGMRV